MGYDAVLGERVPGEPGARIMTGTRTGADCTMAASETAPTSKGSCTMFASKDLAIASTAQGWDEPTNTPNPILVRFRKWVEGETLSDPCWAEEWLAAMGDPDLVVDAGRALDEVYAIPYLRGVRAAQELHARAVLTRLHRLAVAASEMSL